MLSTSLLAGASPPCPSACPRATTPNLDPANRRAPCRYFRSGAPSVINPLRTHFPRDTAVPGSFALTLTWTLPNRTTGVFNVTSPLPGDWFLAAHLPKDEGKISVKVRGFGAGWELGGTGSGWPLGLAARGAWGGCHTAWQGSWASLEGGYRGRQHPNSLLGPPPAPVLTARLAQGLYEECQYLFQPQLIVQRLVNIAVLYPGYASEQSMGPHNRSCLYK